MGVKMYQKDTLIVRKILKRCAGSKPVMIGPDGDLKSGRWHVPAAQWRDLLRRGLVCVRDGRLTVTQEGRALLKRLICEDASPDQAYAAQHRDVHVQQTEPGGPVVTINRSESPLTRLAARKGRDGRPLITPRQLAAGEKLREDYHAAGIMPQTTRDYGAMAMGKSQQRGPVGLMPSDVRLDAKKRVDHAFAAVGPGLNDVLERVCCWLEGLEQVELALSWPVRSCKIVLSIALDRLADHYEGKNVPIRFFD